MKVFHIRVGKFGRAFAGPSNCLGTKIVLLFRGWRPFNKLWWSKPSPNQRQAMKEQK